MAELGEFTSQLGDGGFVFDDVYGFDIACHLDVDAAALQGGDGVFGAGEDERAEDIVVDGFPIILPLFGEPSLHAALVAGVYDGHEFTAFIVLEILLGFVEEDGVGVVFDAADEVGDGGAGHVEGVVAEGDDGFARGGFAAAGGPDEIEIT